MSADRPITLLVCALGGEGGGVLAEWLVETATACGHAVQSTSIPGVAQRTGATTYYVEIFPRPDRELGGLRPVFSLNPVPGDIDLLASSELLETVRQIGLGMATRERTRILTSDSRALTVAEKMQPADGRVDEATLRGIVQAHALEAIVLDLPGLAKQSGTAISAVLFGAIAATGLLPLAREACEATIRRSALGVDASLRGFRAAWKLVADLRAARAPLQHAVDELRRGEKAFSAPGAGTLPKPLADAERWPLSMRTLVALGHARLVDYQDEDYARLYLQRLERVLAAERAGVEATKGGSGAHGGAEPAEYGAVDARVASEAARWLALWMAFDDIVRVAALKVRASRMQRVRRELQAGDDDVVRVWDHFKPGVPEISGLLPRRWADALARWDRARIARGREPWAWPLKIGTHTLAGTFALRVLAGCRGLRRRGSRWAAEQALIERWLVAIEDGAREDPALGLEIAACGRLIKGYGATNERGKATLLHVIDQLARPARREADARADDAPTRARAIRAAREAALADASGSALDRTLAQHGVAPRPPLEQPVRIVRRRPAHVGKITSAPRTPSH